jgi:hypothetical protein
MQIRCPRCHCQDVVDDDRIGNMKCKSCHVVFKRESAVVVVCEAPPPRVHKWIRELADEIYELVKEVGVEPFREAVMEWAHEHVVSNDVEKRFRAAVEKEVKAGRTWTASDYEKHLNQIQLKKASRKKASKKKASKKKHLKKGEPAPEGHMLVGVSDGEEEHRYVWVLESLVIEPDPDADLIEKTLDIAQSSDTAQFSPGDRQLSRIERLTLFSAIHDRCQTSAEKIYPWSIEDPNPIGGARYFLTVRRIGNLTPQPSDEVAPDENLATLLRNTLDVVRKDLELPGRRGTKKKTPQKPTVNERMKKTMQENPESLGWSAKRWAIELKCGKSTVAETECWRSLLLVRLNNKAEAALKKQRQKKRR